MKISEIITDKYKLRIPPTVYYDLLADVQEVEEDQEPNYSEIPAGSITENCISCKYDEIEESDGEHCKKCLAGDSQFELDKEFVESTTKNDLGVDRTDMIDKSNFSKEQYKVDLQSAYDCGYEQAKNDLGVDCIDRNYATRLLADIYHNSISDSSLKIYQIINWLNQLPSVTPQETRWISVSERLPDTDDEVLCWYEYYHWSQEKVLPEYGIGCYFKETSAWYGEVAVGRDVRVIAWMPLSKPYSEVKE